MKNLKLISDVDGVGSGTIGLEEFFKIMTHKNPVPGPKGRDPEGIPPIG